MYQVKKVKPRKDKSPCDDCKTRASCKKMCKSLAAMLPPMIAGHWGGHPREEGDGEC